MCIFKKKKKKRMTLTLYRKSLFNKSTSIQVKQKWDKYLLYPISQIEL